MKQRDNGLICYWCGWNMMTIHGHYSCVNPICWARTMNQMPCCSGEK